MSSKVIGAHIPLNRNIKRAGDLQPGALVKIVIDPKQHVETGELAFGLATGNFGGGIDLISLSDQRSWSHILPGSGPFVEPLPVGSQIVLEAIEVEVPQAPAAPPAEEEEEEEDEWHDPWDFEGEEPWESSSFIGGGR